MPKKNFFVKESELDDFQLKIVNSNADNSLVVAGCAGSGKSILALWKAKQIQDNNQGTFQIIVFTKALKQYIFDAVQQIGINSANVFYHYEWKNVKHSPESDYLIVDEAQDFEEKDIREFMSKARKALLLYGDSAQQLYLNKKNLDGSFTRTLNMNQIREITKFPQEYLVFNHRLPKKIARLAQHIIAKKDDLEGRCKNEGIELPYILEYSTTEKQLEGIAEIIKNKNLSDVGILFKNNEEVKAVFNFFLAKGINVEAKYSYNESKMTLNFNTDNPKLMTYHSAKGLQFETVFLPFCNATEEIARNPLYVATTRSYQSLYITYNGERSHLFDPIPSELYKTSLISETELL
jgi:superfamily I DNA/RNA helicase